jgi:hypothetical protein
MRDSNSAGLRLPIEKCRHPPNSRWRATFRKHVTWDSRVVRFTIVLHARTTIENDLDTFVVEKSPIVTSIASPPAVRSATTAQRGHAD